MNKNSALALLCAAVALPCAASATVWNLTKGNTITAMLTAADDYDIYYSGTAGQRARIGDTDNKLIHYYPYTLTLKAGGQPIPDTEKTSTTPQDWNFLGGFQMDVKAASGTKTIINNESNCDITYQIGHFDIINTTADATATAKIDLGSGKMAIRGGSNIQTPTINFNVDGIITTTNTSNDAIYLQQYGRINVAANKKLTITSKMTVDGGSAENADARINVAAGATLESQGVVTLNNYANVNILGTWKTRGLQLNGNSTVYVYDFRPAVGVETWVRSSMTVGSNTVFTQTMLIGGTLTQNAGTATTFSRWFTIKNGGNFATEGYLKIDGNSDPTHAAWAQVTIESDAGYFYVNDTTGGRPRVVFQNGELIFNKANAITTSNGDLLNYVNTTSTSHAIIRLNASQTFINIYANEKNFDIYLSTENDSTLTSNFTVDNGFLSRFVIHDFEDDRICVSSVHTYSGAAIDDPNLAFTAYRTINDEEVKVDTLYIVDGWLTSVAPVPEPSTWAAILGAVALAFAIRRRK